GHRDRGAQGHEARQETRRERHHAQRIAEDDEQRDERRRPHVVGEPAYRRLEAVPAEPAEELLRAVRPDHDGQDQALERHAARIVGVEEPLHGEPPFPHPHSYAPVGARLAVAVRPHCSEERTMAATIDDVTDMLVFARVVEEKSFTAAARQLGLSKSVVSARVMRLEGRLGERLLHRTTRRLALTDAGLRFYDRCARVAAEADEAAGVAEGVGAAVRGSLRMTAPVGFAQLHLTAPLAAFLERWPEVRLELSVTDRRVDIVGERFDVAVRVAARMAGFSLVARRIATDRMRLL